MVRQHEARREDRKKNYEALAVEYVKEMRFPGIGRAPASMQEAIRFHVMEDVDGGGWRTSRLAETHTLLLLFLLPGHIVLDFLQ